MTGIALEAHGVSKAYGTRAALCDVPLVVERGRVHGLLGPNGAGKTTLMRVLLGLVRPDAGTVTVLGHPLPAIAGAVPDGVAGLLDAAAFYPYLSGRRNLMLLARLDGVPRPNRCERVEAVLAQTGLTAHADARVAGYSAGMRQRLGLAAALLRAPELVLLDEPTSSLDPGGAREVRALARQLASEGAAVVWSSHDMVEVEELCSSLTILDGGRVVFSGTAEALRQRAPAPPQLLRTADDRAAGALAARWSGIRAMPAAGGGIEVVGDLAALDGYVVALGCAGIAIRALERRTRSLESLFLELTAGADVVASAPPAHADEPDWELAS
jgi:ABC-2 type transport system ATP-binding protein